MTTADRSALAAQRSFWWVERGEPLTKWSRPDRSREDEPRRDMCRFSVNEHRRWARSKWGYRHDPAMVVRCRRTIRRAYDHRAHHRSAPKSPTTISLARAQTISGSCQKKFWGERTGSTHGLSATDAFYGIIPPPSVLREPCRRACGDRWTRCSTSPVHGLSVAVRGLTGGDRTRAQGRFFPLPGRGTSLHTQPGRLGTRDRVPGCIRASYGRRNALVRVRVLAWEKG